MMSSHLCESGIRPDTAEGSRKAGSHANMVAGMVAAMAVA